MDSNVNYDELITQLNNINISLNNLYFSIKFVENNLNDCFSIDGNVIEKDNFDKISEYKNNINKDINDIKQSIKNK